MEWFADCVGAVMVGFCVAVLAGFSCLCLLKVLLIWFSFFRCGWKMQWRSWRGTLTRCDSCGVHIPFASWVLPMRKLDEDLVLMGHQCPKCALADMESHAEDLNIKYNDADELADKHETAACRFRMEAQANLGHVRRLEKERTRLSTDLLNLSIIMRDCLHMPKALTAENGAKALLIGEFHLDLEVPCTDCLGDDSVGCDECKNEGTITERVAVDWDTIKEIYAKATALAEPIPEMDLLTPYHEIDAERTRQDAEWGVQNHGPFEWLAILGEEVGEANKGALEASFDAYDSHGDFSAYRKELVQVAAVAVAMIECYDRNLDEGDES